MYVEAIILCIRMYKLEYAMDLLFFSPGKFQPGISVVLGVFATWDYIRWADRVIFVLLLQDMCALRTYDIELLQQIALQHYKLTFSLPE